MTTQSAGEAGRLPTFLIVGAMKSGTSSLRNYLREHPQAYIPDEDELHYFTTGINWKLGEAWYRSRFAAAGDALALGEKSPTYTMHPEHPGVPERIARLIPDARLVYVVRNPLDRIRSHYLHQLARGRERQPIELAIRDDRRYLDTTRYAQQLDQYLDWFPRDQILVVTSDDLDHRRGETVARVAEFIGIDPTFAMPGLGERAHQSKTKWVPANRIGRLKRVRGMYRLSMLLPLGARDALRARLMRPLRPDEARIEGALESWVIEQLTPDVERLRPWLGQDFDGWGWLGPAPSVSAPPGA